MYWLGIDAGTAFTTAATVDSGTPAMVLLGPDRPAIPSVVHLRDRELAVGPVALSRGDADPAGLITSFKRSLGTAIPLLVDGQELSADWAFTELLRWTNARVIQMRGELPAATVVSHPANWSPTRQIIFGEVVSSAGLTNPSTITDPQAAALAYSLDHPVDHGSIVGVYDLGAGTFDTAILRRSTDGFVAAGPPSGIDRLGGLDLDQAIFNYALREAGVDGGRLDDEDVAVQLALRDLRTRTTAAKLGLSVADSVTIAVSLGGVTAAVPLSRTMLESLARPLVQQSIDALQRGLRVAQVEPADLTTILLVGASTRLPLVEQMVTEALGVAVTVSADPKNLVARGAALQARSLAGSGPNIHPVAAPSRSGPTELIASTPVVSEPVVDEARPTPFDFQDWPGQNPMPSSVGAVSSDPIIAAPIIAAPVDEHATLVSPPPPIDPPSFPPIDENDDGKRRGHMLLALALVTIAGLIAAALLFVFSAEEVDAAMQIFAEPVSSVGIDPFTPDLVPAVAELNPPPGELASFVDSIELVPLSQVPDSNESPKDERIVTTSGDAVGLYGGTEQLAVCDTQKLVDFLATNPDKASAWAAVHRIQPGQIAEFIDGLTVAVLTRDTLVTNHGFRDGRANAFQSLLQAGNAVLVDERGVPRVRCKCGNPMLAPMELGEEIEIVGQQWRDLELSQAVVIRPSGTRLTEFVVTDIEEGGERVVLVGERRGGLLGGPNPTLVPEGETGPTALGAAPAPLVPEQTPPPIDAATPTATAVARSTATAVPPTAVPPTAVPATAVPPTAVPPTAEPRTEVLLTGLGTVTANSTFSGFQVGAAVDNDIGSSWFSTGPGIGPGVFTWSGPRAEFTQITIIGNEGHRTPEFRSGFGFSSASIEVFDGATSVFTSSGSGRGDQWRPNVLGDRIVLTFTGHEDPTCGGFAELIVQGLL